MHDPGYWRQQIRTGQWRRPTAGLAPGYLQANLVIVPGQEAADFLLFCERNPEACPLLECTAPGDPVPRRTAPGADLRTDVPRYRVYAHGHLAGEYDDLHDLWRPDLVAFLLGCSFTFEAALQEAGIPLRHIALGRNVSMYVTNRPCRPVGRFAGPLVVSMRPVAPSDLSRVVEISGRFPLAHGKPVHIGDPGLLGIRDLSRPDYGDPVPVLPGEVPVFWACGVTPQAVAVQARLPLVITHAPGHMFITDVRAELAAGPQTQEVRP
ncbi:MAG: putative hydro-lyase [Armatimonadota bacterium]|nr:putative hydro-lyase [Armatimonadota bacterium]MDR7451639.1 putative hydro-lyase [Armatimonadota bacterium]MDR7467641.1 putative hydro-lyase [Armatimonadota bacterium]MDR7492608.1 putative hydro-lyase [Armatimonadota bacterium]MDR7499924.1 putative hydro-lyase [Armatimonadota bacterium]